MAFQQRAHQIDFTAAEVDALELAGVDTFAKYAFCSEYQPGQSDEKPLIAFLEGALGEAPSDLSKFRRLFFESHALCLQDLRQKVERTEHSETKVLPLAEKVERVNQLKSRLPGLLITQQFEPSHQLIDKAVQKHSCPIKQPVLQQAWVGRSSGLNCNGQGGPAAGDRYPTVLRVERVCSYSNPSDKPSRGDRLAAAKPNDATHDRFPIKLGKEILQSVEALPRDLLTAIGDRIPRQGAPRPEPAG